MILAIFTVPDEATVDLEHDNGITYPSVVGVADGRPAHIIDLPLTLPNGHGAWLNIAWGRKVLRQHGAVYHPLAGGRATFLADVFEEPQGFR
jgi:hypothetical protein